MLHLTQLSNYLALEGSLSAVSTATIASKDAFCRVFQNLRESKTFAPWSRSGKNHGKPPRGPHTKRRFFKAWPGRKTPHEPTNTRSSVTNLSCSGGGPVQLESSEYSKLKFAIFRTINFRDFFRDFCKNVAEFSVKSVIFLPRCSQNFA